MIPLPPELKQLKDWLDVASAVVVAIGVPIGLIRYFFAVRKEQHDREYGTYNALDEKYLSYQKMCMENPALDIFDVPDAAPAALTPAQAKQEVVAFTMLFSIFERAFLMFQDQSTEIKRNQWAGWESYIQSFCARANFRAAWVASGATFDARFQAYMQQLMTASLAAGS